MNIIRRLKINLDWFLVGATVPLVVFGLVTMNSFAGRDYFFDRQIIWVILAYLVLTAFSFIDWRFLRRSETVSLLYIAGLIILIVLFLVGRIKGAQSWLSLGAFSFQPADAMKLILIIVLAKYFSKRHIEIANFRHIIMSGLYTLIPFVLVLLQPDFGSALIIFLIWLGMIIVSGVSKKHLLVLTLAGVATLLLFWLFIFAPYQKARIISFIHPLADIQGAGYNANQSKIAVGSGGWFGKGVGYGTQSRLLFLPEYQTDFIFAAFAEEWGFVGNLIMFFLFGLVVWRILENAKLGATNFETLFGLGVVILLVSHLSIHVGMNMGLLPVTGLPLPFLSYGGSHLLAEFMGLGILMGMRRYSLAYHRDDMRNEFVGPQ